MVDIKKRLLVIVIGVAFILIGVYLLKSENTTREKCTVKVEGRVIELKEEKDSDGNPIYYPIIEYEADGMKRRATGKTGQNPPKYGLGQEFEIYYNPNRVTEIRIEDDDTINTALPVILIVIGGVAALIGVISKG